MSDRGGTFEAKFWAKADWTLAAPGCWEWRGAKTFKGYGVTRIGGRNGVSAALAHRVAYELEVGEIPTGMQLDHLCRNHSCVNPDHLEPVTPGENVRRGLSPQLSSLRMTARHIARRDNV